MSKLSIVTINYNNLEGLKRTVESVVNQTWQEFEYIVIDGGSTDGSAEYIESQSEHLDYWVSEPDKGIYNAMNKGIAKATGEYLLFLNSGDHLYSNSVLEMNHSKIHTEDFIYFNIRHIFNDHISISSKPKKLEELFFIFNTLPHPSTFIRRNLFFEIGNYDENLKIVSDWKFFLFAMDRYKCTSRKVDVVLSDFYAGGICSNIELANEERLIVLKEFSPLFLEIIKLKRFEKDIRKSKTIKFLKKMGLLKWIKTSDEL